MTDQVLNLQLRLLIAQYGKPKVLGNLADLDQVKIEDIEQEIASINAKRKARSRSRRPLRTMMELVDAECRKHPEIAEPLRTLAIAFQNRIFLPQLRDCQRFLEGVNPNQGKLKSRDTAAKPVLCVLVELARHDLERLIEQNSESKESDFSALARTIMQGSSTNKENQH